MDTYTHRHNMPYAPTDTADLYPETDGEPMAASDFYGELYRMKTIRSSVFALGLLSLLLLPNAFAYDYLPCLIMVPESGFDAMALSSDGYCEVSRAALHTASNPNKFGHPE